MLEPIARVTVIVGSASPNRHRIIDRAARLACPVDVLTNPDNIAGHLAEADLCVGAAGGSAWERCAVGLPSLLIVLAENQKGIAGFLAQSEAALSVNEGDDAAFDHAFQALCDPQRRRVLSSNAMELVDGAGTGRVVDAMMHAQ